MAGRKLLIVDDHADFRRLFADLLSARGFDVSETSNGREALIRLRSGSSFGLIVLDLAMPDMDGFAFLEVRQQEPALLDVPVVVLTAQSAELDRIGLYSVHDVLSKPVPFDTLLRVARTYCS